MSVKIVRFVSVPTYTLISNMLLLPPMNSMAKGLKFLAIDLDSLCTFRSVSLD